MFYGFILNLLDILDERISLCVSSGSSMNRFKSLSWSWLLPWSWICFSLLDLPVFPDFLSLDRPLDWLRSPSFLLVFLLLLLSPSFLEDLGFLSIILLSLYPSSFSFAPDLDFDLWVSPSPSPPCLLDFGALYDSFLLLWVDAPSLTGSSSSITLIFGLTDF